MQIEMLGAALLASRGSSKAGQTFAVLLTIGDWRTLFRITTQLNGLLCALKSEGRYEHPQVAGGNGEQCLSRDVYRLGTQFDFMRLMAWYAANETLNPRPYNLPLPCRMKACFVCICWLLYMCLIAAG